MRPIMQSFRITEAEAEALKCRAAREGISASELLRRAVADFLDAFPPDGAGAEAGGPVSARRVAPFREAGA